MTRPRISRTTGAERLKRSPVRATGHAMVCNSISCLGWHSVTLQQQAEAIWRSGVAAVDSATLVRHAIHRRPAEIRIGDETLDIGKTRRIVVVGAGKAGAGMAAGVEAALGSDLVNEKVVGWVNVPSDCVRPLEKIHLHAARPAGVNEPTIDGVTGSERIIELVSSLTDDDLCLVLISGGGSALLPAPVHGISLEDKLAVTRCLMHSGATIQELNTVRKRLSRIKGGGLLRAASAGRMISLIISDVPDDPLDIIASGPTVCDAGSADDALEVLKRFAKRGDPDSKVPDSIWRVLEEQLARDHRVRLGSSKEGCDSHEAEKSPHPTSPHKAGAKSQASSIALGDIAASCHPDDSNAGNIPVIECCNLVIGNNQTALDAAALHARTLGLEVRSLGSNRQGIAREVGIELAELCLAARNESSNTGICYIAGGEPTVKLAITNKPRRGGRNQEVALSAGCRWGDEDIHRLVVLSGGTDGEDGPTDAAGAFFDAAVQQNARKLGLNLDEFLAINDAYTYFDQTGGLLKTGPTHTNVMDLQIGLVAGVRE